MFKRIANIAWKEIVQLARAWVLVFVIIGPTLELALIAQTVSTGVSHLPVAIVDQDRTPISRELIAALDNHQDLDVKEFLSSPDEISGRLESNDITLAVIFPAGLEDEVAGGDGRAGGGEGGADGEERGRESALRIGGG